MTKEATMNGWAIKWIRRLLCRHDWKPLYHSYQCKNCKEVIYD